MPINCVKKKLLFFIIGLTSCIHLTIAQQQSYQVIVDNNENPAISIQEILVQDKVMIIRLKAEGGKNGTSIQIQKPESDLAPYLKAGTTIYKLLTAKNIAFTPKQITISPKQFKTFELHFEPIPLCTGRFNLVEKGKPTGQNLNFSNIRLIKKKAPEFTRFSNKKAFKKYFDKKTKTEPYEGFWEVQYYVQATQNNKTNVTDIETDTVAILYENNLYRVFYLDGRFYGSEFQLEKGNLNYLFLQESGIISCTPVTIENANTLQLELELGKADKKDKFSISGKMYYQWSRLGTKTTMSSSNAVRKSLNPTKKMGITADNFPHILETEKGLDVSTKQDWWAIRRPELLALFQNEVYGIVPNQPIMVRHKVLNQTKNALNGLAIRKEIEFTFTNNKKTIKAILLLYLPQSESVTVPVFLGYNFYGNHTIFPDSEIAISKSWVDNDFEMGIFNHQATELSRGAKANRWPLLHILKRGYGLATMYYGDIDPDFDDDFQNGIHPLFYKDKETKPSENEWGSIGAWTYGLSRAMDYLETDNAIDPNRVIVMGHSRLGKTALWAGAQDQRFGGVIANNSGCVGAALSRRRVGETFKAINDRFPHWFCENFKQYNDKEDNLAIDQHQLLALIAPRPVYIASAEKDTWADPLGEFLGGQEASIAFEFLGRKGLVADTLIVNQPYHEGYIGYHQRSGKHDLTYYDWEQFMNFMDIRLEHTTKSEDQIAPQQPQSKKYVYLGGNVEKGLGVAETVKVGNTIYVTALSGEGKNMKTQLQNAYKRLQMILDGYNISPKQVVKETVFTTDMPAFLKANSLRKQFYGDNSRVIFSSIGVERLVVKTSLVEMEIIISLE